MPKITRRTATSIAMLAALAFLCWYAIGCGGDDDEQTGEPSVEATIAAVVAEISATQEAEAQAAVPTNTPRPAPTPTMVLPTPTEAPTPTAPTAPTPADSAEAWSAPLTPLSVSDPGWFLASLSDQERVCVSQEVSGEQLATLAASPETATQEERQALIGCLEDETILRLFLTPVLTATGPLSDESSACLRTGFADTDLAAVLLAASGEPGANPDAEAAMALAMVSFMVSLSCLNEDEFLAAGPTMGISPEEYENFQCVLEAVGGPEEMAALMNPGAGFPAPLFAAAFDCEVQMAGPPTGQ